MPTLTEKQQSFAAHKAAGLNNRDAVIAAGYAPTAADVTASKLMQRPDIKAAIKAAKKNVPADEDEQSDAKNKMPKARYSDAKEFLLDAMNHPKLPIALRGDYAKALLPYQHPRIGEAGKKDKAKDRAHEVAGKPKFAPKAAPGSNVVTMRR